MKKQFPLYILVMLVGIGLWLFLFNYPDHPPGGTSVVSVSGGPFPSIPPCFSEKTPEECDRVRLPEGYTHSVLVTWHDPRFKEVDWFGFNSDLAVYFPVDTLEGGASSREGFLWVNHEYVSPLLFHGRYLHRRSRTQIDEEKQALGGSLIHVRFDKKSGVWTIDPGLTDEDMALNPFTRRITAHTPILLTGPAAGSKWVRYRTEVKGTLADCGGAKTPWNTVLIGEENYHLFDRTELKYTNWEDAGEKLFDTHYGWMVEVDPFDPDWPPRKHTAMGRMRHENAALTVSRETGRVVAYMGEDREDRFIFKFVTKGAYQPDQREENKNLFSEGAIFVAGFDRETAQGKWIPLTLEEPRLAERFEDEAELLVHLSEAASLLLDHPKQVERSRTIPFSRPEDLEIHPLDGSVYAALTGNPAGGDFFGEIVRLVEQGDPAVSKFFTLERFAAGGLPDGFVNPDNLFFDSRGNLWVAEDMSPYALNRGFYRKHGNNGLFMIPTAGPLKGRPFRFATAPNGAEFSGPWFTPDEKTLFLSVQHPGETTYLPEDSTEEPVWTSHWPPDNDPRPRPGVIAIQGF